MSILVRIISTLMKNASRNIFSVLLFLFVLNLSAQAQRYDQKVIYRTKFDDAIPVLNVASFHFGETEDANTTAFDAHSKENKKEIHKVAAMLAAFKPTIIIIEDLPINDAKILANYLEYCKNPKKIYKDPTEIELLAYEVGRLSGVKKIYGIDFKQGYNYDIGSSLENPISETTNNKYWAMMSENEKRNPEEGIPFIDMFKINNHPQYLESMIIINADYLTHVATPGNHEGADEAAKFYHRNLVIFSNLNQIPIEKGDRIFILMGGAHTAFLNDFLKRSPKYSLENVFDYVK